jgi:hypothetical protein
MTEPAGPLMLLLLVGDRFLFWVPGYTKGDPYKKNTLFRKIRTRKSKKKRKKTHFLWQTALENTQNVNITRNRGFLVLGFQKLLVFGFCYFFLLRSRIRKRDFEQKPTTETNMVSV